MTLSRPLVSVDVETTGVDSVTDRVIQFGAVVYNPDGSRKQWETLINPGFHIPEEATAIHGITDEMVASAPIFPAVAVKIHKGLSGRDIVGYNLRGLDLPILDEELRRCNLKLDLTGIHVIDAFGIFQNKEKRDLESAVAKYCGRSHEGAHGALADADATLDVLFGQLKTYEDLATMELAEIAAFSRRGDKEPVDIAGKLYRDKDGALRYNFGKCRDVRVVDDPGFGMWMLRQSSPGFPGSTCEILRAELEGVA